MLTITAYVRTNKHLCFWCCKDWQKTAPSKLLQRPPCPLSFIFGNFGISTTFQNKVQCILMMFGCTAGVCTDCGLTRLNKTKSKVNKTTSLTYHLESKLHPRPYGCCTSTILVDNMPGTVRWIWASCGRCVPVDGGSSSQAMGELADEGRRRNAGLWFLWSWKLSCPSLSLSRCCVWPRLPLPRSCQTAETAIAVMCELVSTFYLQKRWTNIIIVYLALVLSLSLFTSLLPLPRAVSWTVYLCFSNVRGVWCSDSWLCGCIWMYLWFLDFLRSPLVWFSLWPLLALWCEYLCGQLLFDSFPSLPLCCSLWPTLPHDFILTVSISLSMVYYVLPFLVVSINAYLYVY